MRTKLLAVLLFALALPMAVCAQTRHIPDIAKRGHIAHVRGPIVEIDGQQMRLSAGAQIRGPNNLIIMPASLPPGALAKYLLDATGRIHRVWLLTPQEAAAPDKKGG